MRVLAGVLLAGLIGVGGCGPRRPPIVPEGPPAGEPAFETIERSSARLRDALAAYAAAKTATAARAVATEYYGLGVFDQAESFLSRALERAPRDAELFDLRARVWRDWGVPDRALADAHRAVWFAPGSAAALNTLGTVQFALGQRQLAQATFEKALALDPAAAWASNNLCYLFLLEGDESRALDHCRTALASDPALAPARNNLALIHASAGRLDDASREFQAAGPAAIASYNLGIVHLARGDYDRAVEAFERALRESPDFDAAFRRAREARRLAAGQRTGRSRETPAERK